MAEPLAGGSTFSSCEPKDDYDEELDFFSSKFNPERALYSQHVSVPYPDIKSFQSLQKYEDAVKLRSKSKHGKPEESKSTEKHVGLTTAQGACTSRTEDQQRTGDTVSTGESSKSCDKPSNASADAKSTEVYKLLSAHPRSGTKKAQGQTHGLLLKPSPVLVAAATSSRARPSGKLLANLSYQTEEKNSQTSVAKDINISSLLPTSGHEKASSVSADSSTSSDHSRKSYSLDRSRYSHNKLIQNLNVQISTTGDKDFPHRYVKIRENASGYLPGSDRHVHATRDEKRSHSVSSHDLEKQNESFRSLERSAGDVHKPSGFCEHSEQTLLQGKERSTPDTGVLLTFDEKQHATSTRSQERTAQSSRYGQKAFKSLSENKGRYFSSVPRSAEQPACSSSIKHERQLSSCSATSDRQESDSDNKLERRHSDAGQGFQAKFHRPKTTRLEKTVSKKEHTQPIEVPEHVDAASSAPGKNKKSQPRNVFTRMERMSGPLRMLTRCVQENLQVRVMTRGAVTVKSICRGYIVAFDKHCNMALIDVDEIYRRPAVLGKVKSRRSHKLLAAQNTLQREREQYMEKWNEQLVKSASKGLQDLSIETNIGGKDQPMFLECPQEVFSPDPSLNQFSKTGNSSSRSSLRPHARLTSAPKRETALCHSDSDEDVQVPHKTLSKSAQVLLRRMQSVYEGQKVPLSPFEREALMLGISDENVDHRHINQLFIRGENIVSISIIEDF